MSASQSERALAYLHRHNVMTLATCDRDSVWAAAVFYVNDGFTLYFLSSPSSRHALNMTQQPRVAATVHEDYADWREIKGVQLEGTVCEIPPRDEKRARALYAEKFPLVGTLAQAPSAIVKAMARVRWYRLVPEHLHFIDNSAGFGHRTEVRCADPHPTFRE